MFLKHTRCFTILMIGYATFFFNIVNAQKTTNESHQLSPSQQSIAVIAALTATGDLQQLSKALNAGLDSGLTINEEKEVLVHLYAYCGFPRSLQGINTLMSVVEERAKKGIQDKAGRAATSLPDSSNKYQRGKDVLQMLTGQPEREPKTGYAAFSPEIDVFLKEHLFADIFSRDVLDYTSREIATVSALVSLGGVEPMMKSHMGIIVHLGVTKDGMEQLVTLIEPYIGKEKAAIARKVLPVSPDTDNSKNSNASAPKSENKKENVEKVGTENEGSIFPKGSKVTNENFSGPAWLQMMVTDQAAFDCTVGNVTFEPGVRNNWHKHPGGQILLVTSGTGYYQERGKPIQLLHKGDVVQCLPNIAHWHGASPNSQFSHLAITTNSQKGPVVWLEPVTDEEYRKYDN